MGSATSTAAPERARWPRLAAAPHRQLRSLLPRGYAGFTEATVPRHLVHRDEDLVFLEASLLDAAGAVIATATATARVISLNRAPAAA